MMYHNEQIEALEKRIAELEETIASDQRTISKLDGLISIMVESGRKDLRAITTERKRREECEAVLLEVAGAPNRIAENSRIIADYFSRYEL